MSDPDCGCLDCGIRRTMARYTIAGDRGRADELAATFAPDGVLDGHAWRAQGREQIADCLRGEMTRMKPGLTTARHHVTSCLIEQSGEGEATARSYFMVLTDIGLDHSGLYTDRLVRDGQEWLFAERRVKLNWISPETLFSL